jgi:hypothetical protein
MELVFLLLFFHSIFWVYLIARKINILHEKITKNLVSSFVLLLIACSILWAIIYFFAPEDELFTKK